MIVDKLNPLKSDVYASYVYDGSDCSLLDDLKLQVALKLLNVCQVLYRIHCFLCNIAAKSHIGSRSSNQYVSW